jgi:RimJ/RimL family protein N-acetyltransferase
MHTLQQRLPLRMQRLLSPVAVCRAIRRRLWYRMEVCFYSYPLEKVRLLPHPKMFRRDCFEDLEHYQPIETDRMPVDEYWQESRKRRAQGNHLYTLIKNETLIYYSWLVDRQERSEDPLLGQVFLPPVDASIIFDSYTHPTARGQGLHYQALCQMLHDAQDIARAGQVCICAFADNAASRHVIEKIGFRYIGSMIKDRRLFVQQRYAIAVEPAFRTALM